MKFVVALTDQSWLGFLRTKGAQEVNHWTRATTDVKIPVGTPWLFKLHAPIDKVVGGGFFVQATRLPLRVAWDTFGDENGAATYDDFKRMIGRQDPGDIVGCRVMCETFYWPEDQWLDQPSSWARHSQRYQVLETDEEPGYWASVTERLTPSVSLSMSSTTADRLGKPALHIPRLGQGAFRSGIIDAYSRRCTVTGERTLPALEAAHIVPFAEVRRHDLRNGLLLRADLHKLFDDGYVTVDPKYRFLVSRRIKDEYENGRDYYALHGRAIRLPEDPAVVPDPTFLEMHASHKFQR